MSEKSTESNGKRINTKKKTPEHTHNPVEDKRRIGHAWFDHFHTLYEKGTKRKRGYYPMYVRYEDTGEDEFIALVRWRRDDLGVTVIDQSRFYKMYEDKEDD